MHLEDPETVTGAVASLVSDSMNGEMPSPKVPVVDWLADPFSKE